MKYFIDCGHNLGQGLKKLCENRNILNNPEWQVFVFDISPECIGLSERENQWTNVEYRNEAVWVENGEMTARLQTTQSDEEWDGKTYSKGQDIGGGSTILPKSLINNELFPNILGPAAAWQKTTEVPTIDFCQFLKDLPDVEYLIIKMDIEGAEFYVLPKMIEEGLLGKMDEFICEFHRDITNCVFDSVEVEIMSEIQKLGIKFTRWY